MTMDFYCERVNDNFFNEPINAISNVFFLIISVFTYKLQKELKVKKNILSSSNFNFLHWTR